MNLLVSNCAIQHVPVLHSVLPSENWRQWHWYWFCSCSRNLMTSEKQWKGTVWVRQGQRHLNKSRWTRQSRQNYLLLTACPISASFSGSGNVPRNPLKLLTFLTSSSRLWSCFLKMVSISLCNSFARASAFCCRAAKGLTAAAWLLLLLLLLLLPLLLDDVGLPPEDEEKARLLVRGALSTNWLQLRRIGVLVNTRDLLEEATFEAIFLRWGGDNIIDSPIRRHVGEDLINALPREKW